MEIMPDHVHIFIDGKPCYEPQYIVNQLKGYTSRMLCTPSMAPKQDSYAMDKKLLHRICRKHVGKDCQEIHREQEWEMMPAFISRLKTGGFPQAFSNLV